jgi:hypothetical protein
VFYRVSNPKMNITVFFIKAIWLLGIVYIAFSLSGCTDVTSSMSNITAETPHPALTNLTETLKCMGREINKSDMKGILLLVDDFYDGTVPVIPENRAVLTRLPRENGPLADGGKYDFEAVIRRSISNKKIIIPYSPPTGLLQEDKYGTLPPDYLKNLAKKYGASAIVRVKGVFTQNDTSDYLNKGIGSGAELDGNDGQSKLEYGVSRSARSLSLTIYLGDAFSNTLGAATTLTLNTYTESDKFSIGFGYGDGNMSFAKQTRLREGLHGAQRTLVEAAVLWALRGIYGHLDFSGCFKPDGPTPNTTITAYQKWLQFDEHERIKYLKLMLRELDYYHGEIDKNYDVALQEAISKYEIKHDMLIPHTISNLGDLFILLYLDVDFAKIDKLAHQKSGLF